MYKCKNCGNEFSGKFCPQCGTASETPDVKICPECGEKVHKLANFCNNCGHSFMGDFTQNLTETISGKNPPVNNAQLFVDDVDRLYKFIKSFATDEQITKAKECYDESYGKGAYERMLSILGMNGGIDSNKHLDGNIDEHANLIFNGLKTLVECINSGKTWQKYEYRLLAHVFMIVELGRIKIASRVVKKVEAQPWGKGKI